MRTSKMITVSNRFHVCTCTLFANTVKNSGTTFYILENHGRRIRYLIGQSEHLLPHWVLLEEKEDIKALQVSSLNK